MHLAALTLPVSLRRVPERIVVGTGRYLGCDPVA